MMGIIGDLASKNAGLDPDAMKSVQKELVGKSDASDDKKQELISQVDKSANGLPASWGQENLADVLRNNKKFQEGQDRRKVLAKWNTFKTRLNPDKDKSAPSDLSELGGNISQWLNEQAPRSEDLVETDVDGQERVKLEPSKSRFADEYENQLENGELSGAYGIPNYYSDPSESSASDWHHLIASIGNLPSAIAKSIYGEPEWGYNLDNGRYASYDDVSNLYSNEGFSNSYLLSKDDDQIYRNEDGLYIELPSGNYGQAFDADGNEVFTYDQDTDSFRFPNVDEKLDYADTQDAMLLPGIPIDMSERMPEDLMPNSDITWRDLMSLIDDEDAVLVQQNPGFLGLNKQRYATPDSESDALSRIKDALPESVEDFPNWFTRVLASSAPFMLPGPVGPAVALMTGLSDAKLASLGLDPTTYDPETQTYAPAVNDTNGDRLWRMAGSFVDPVIDAAMGVGGMKLGKKMNSKLISKAADGDSDAIKKLVKKMEKEDFKHRYPILPQLGKIAEEGLEEVPGQWMQHVADVGGLENLGMNKNEEGEYDHSTSLQDRIKNETLGYMLPDFLGGALFGAALEAPKTVGSTIKTGKSLKEDKRERKDRFKDFEAGQDEYDLTDKMKQYINSQEDFDEAEH